MKDIKLLTPLFISIIFLAAFAGCDKAKLANAIANSGPCNCGYSLESYSVQIKKSNTYPVGSHLVIDRHGHPKNDSSVIYDYGLLSKDLPFNDTTLFGIDIPDYSHYLTWKVTAVNGDSLSGGKTPVQTVRSSTPPFHINY